MSAYVIGIRKRTLDAQRWEAYTKKARPTLPEGSRALVKFGKIDAVEGDPPEGLAIFEFASFEQAVAWYHGPAYQEALKERLGAADFELYIVDGAHV